MSSCWAQRMGLTSSRWGRGAKTINSVELVHRFLIAQASVYNLFNLGRHLESVESYRFFQLRVSASWESAVAI
jgi:putative transposase